MTRVNRRGLSRASAIRFAASFLSTPHEMSKASPMGIYWTVNGSANIAPMSTGAFAGSR